MRVDVPTLNHVASGALTFASTVDILSPVGEVTAQGVPVLAGKAVWKAGESVPDQLEGLHLPQEWRQWVLDPHRVGTVLGVDGHTLQVTSHVESISGGETWTIPVGRYLVTGVEASGGQVAVEASGMLQRMVASEDAAPTGLPVAALFATEVDRLMHSDGLRLDADEMPARWLPAGTVRDVRHIEWLRDLLESWPGRVVPDGHGVVRVLPVRQGGALVAEWTDGSRGDAGAGTVVDAPRKADRGDTYNHVVIEWAEALNGSSERGPTQYLSDEVRTGRYSVRTFGRTTKRVTGDNITSRVQAEEILRDHLWRVGSRSSTLQVTGVCDWRPELYDNVQVTREGQTYTGSVLGYELPLTPSDGHARWDVGVTL